MEWIFILIQTMMLVIALGIDAFICSFSYGANKIKIPLKTVFVINIVTVTLLLTGIVISRLLSPVLPLFLMDWLPFVILTMLGLSKIFEGVIKALIRKSQEQGEVKFSFFNVDFILKIYADYKEADVDHSKVLSIKEAIPLAVALGIDGLSVGFSVGLTAITIPLLLSVSLLVEFLCVVLGTAMGRRVANVIKFDLSVVSGLILIMVAVFELLS